MVHARQRKLIIFGMEKLIIKKVNIFKKLINLILYYHLKKLIVYI